MLNVPLRHNYRTYRSNKVIILTHFENHGTLLDIFRLRRKSFNYTYVILFLLISDRDNGKSETKNLVFSPKTYLCKKYPDLA